MAKKTKLTESEILQMCLDAENYENEVLNIKPTHAVGTANLDIIALKKKAKPNKPLLH